MQFVQQNKACNLSIILSILIIYVVIIGNTCGETMQDTEDIVAVHWDLGIKAEVTINFRWNIFY